MAFELPIQERVSTFDSAFRLKHANRCDTLHRLLLVACVAAVFLAYHILSKLHDGHHRAYPHSFEHARKSVVQLLTRATVSISMESHSLLGTFPSCQLLLVNTDPLAPFLRSVSVLNNGSQVSPSKPAAARSTTFHHRQTALRCRTAGGPFWSGAVFAAKKEEVTSR